MSKKYLFIFENKKETIVEVKKLNMPENSLPQDVYFWLKVDKETGNCVQLKFISMQKEPIQIRIFDQGKFTFDTKGAVFETEQENKIYIPLSEAPAYVEKAVSDFLGLK